MSLLRSGTVNPKKKFIAQPGHFHFHAALSGPSVNCPIVLFCDILRSEVPTIVLFCYRDYPFTLASVPMLIKVLRGHYPAVGESWKEEPVQEQIGLTKS
jgi:hypothetical protein